MRVRFPSPAPAHWLFSNLLFVWLLSDAAYSSSWRPGRYFSWSNVIFESSYVDMRGWLDSPLFYPKCQQPSSWSYRLDFAAPLNRRSLHRDVPRPRNGHDPHWLQGFPTAVTLTAPVRSGLEAPKTRRSLFGADSRSQTISPSPRIVRANVLPRPPMVKKWTYSPLPYLLLDLAKLDWFQRLFQSDSRGTPISRASTSGALTPWRHLRFRLAWLASP
jgi:hypothetical protein